MTYIEAKKAEVREKFRAIGEGSVRFVATREEVCEFFAKEIDTLLDEIESRVVGPKPWTPTCGYDSEEEKGFQKGIQAQEALTRRAFQHLRTGGDITS